MRCLIKESLLSAALLCALVSTGHAQATSQGTSTLRAVSNFVTVTDEVMRNPGQYGIENTTAACAGREIFHEDAKPCAKPDSYFYYHAGHPSTAVHKIVGAKLYQELVNRRTEPAKAAK